MAPAAKVSEANEELKEGHKVYIKHLTKNQIDLVRKAQGFPDSMHKHMGKCGTIISIEKELKEAEVSVGSDVGFIWPLWALEKIKV